MNEPAPPPSTEQGDGSSSSSTRQRVLHVIDTLGRVGGAEEQLVQNLNRFRDERLEHAVLCLYRTRDPNRETELPPGVAVDYVYTDHATKVARIAMVRDGLRAISRSAPDLIHCALPDAALAARMAGRWLGVPVVESLVNVSHEPVRTVDNPRVNRSKLLAHRVLDRVTMRGVHTFHALSPSVADSWVGTVGIPRERTVVIPRGVDTERFCPAGDPASKARLRVSLELPEDALVLVNLGRQVAQKGQLYLIRAMPAILASVPSAVLLIAGTSGPLTDRLSEEAIRLGVQSRVRCIGVRNDVPEVLAAADVFVFPSLYEGLGVSLLQAMACGLPSVVSDVPPLNQVVTHEVDGLTVPPTTPAAIAEAVIRLGRSPECRRALGIAARRRIETEFDITDVARRIESLYVGALRLDGS